MILPAKLTRFNKFNFMWQLKDRYINAVEHSLYQLIAMSYYIKS